MERDSSEVFVTISDCWKLFLPFLLFLLRVPRWELQIGCKQQAKEGADGIHQRADSRTGDRIRPSQLFDQTEAVRNRRKPGSHGKAGEMTDNNLVPVHQSFCQKLPLFFFFGFGDFYPALAMEWDYCIPDVSARSLFGCSQVTGEAKEVLSAKALPPCRSVLQIGLCVETLYLEPKKYGLF